MIGAIGDRGAGAAGHRLHPSRDRGGQRLCDRLQPRHAGLGHRRRDRLSRHLRLHSRLVADHAQCVVGGVHRAAVALFAAPAAGSAPRRRPAGTGPDGAGAVDAVARQRRTSNDAGDRRLLGRRNSPRLVRCRRGRHSWDRLLRQFLARQPAVAALGGDCLVDRRAGDLRLAASSRDAAARGRADAGAARRTGVVPVDARPPAAVMTDFDHAAIDEVLHSRVRLAIVAFLAGARTADFSAVRAATKTTDGNASIHLRKLEDAGYVAVEKRFVARRPQTLYSLTERGRQASLAYVAHLENLLPRNGGTWP